MFIPIHDSLKSNRQRKSSCLAFSGVPEITAHHSTSAWKLSSHHFLLTLIWTANISVYDFPSPTIISTRQSARGKGHDISSLYESLMDCSLLCMDLIGISRGLLISCNGLMVSSVLPCTDSLSALTLMSRYVYTIYCMYYTRCMDRLQFVFL